MVKNKQEINTEKQEEAGLKEIEAIKQNSKKYVCNYPVNHDGKLYKEHDLIDIETHHAEKLLAMQAISKA